MIHLSIACITAPTVKRALVCSSLATKTFLIGIAKLSTNLLEKLSTVRQDIINQNSINCLRLPPPVGKFKVPDWWGQFNPPSWEVWGG